MTARSLYTGVGWGHALCAQKLLGQECELWIVSAGFGLLSGDDRVPSYAATFAAEENRVADRLIGFKASSSAHAAWWRNTNCARGRTEAPLQSTFAGYDRVIVALSAPYLMALRADLENLARTLGPDKLWLVAVGAEAQRLAPELFECVVPLRSEVERLVASPRATLNLRALVWWLEEIIPTTGWDKAAQNREIQSRLCALQPKTATVKRSLSDEEVKGWIQEHQQDETGKSVRGGKTGLLRLLRESGLACEQNRFSRLHAEVTTRP